MPTKTKQKTTAKNNKSKNPIQMVAKKTAVPQKIKAVGKKVRGIEPETIAKGAAAVSIAAGVIAAGAMMADKENRRKAGKMVTRGVDFIQGMTSEIADQAQEKYQAVQLSVPLKRSSKSNKKTKRSKS